MLVHLVARALPGQRPLADPAAAWWLWRRLRRAWPNALAACLMPNHVHLLVHRGKPTAAAAQLAHCLSGFTRHVDGGRIWEPIPVPDPIRDAQKVALNLRYVHLNPCRAGLANDPLCWPWSTHRGLLGAEFDPWVTASRLATALHRSARFLPRWLHDFTTRDPSVSAGARRPPVAARPRAIPQVPLQVIVQAAEAATPWSRPSVRRRAVVLLAMAQGWRDTGLLGTATGLKRRRVQVLATQPAPVLLAAASMCLGDPRLRSKASQSALAAHFRTT